MNDTKGATLTATGHAKAAYDQLQQFNRIALRDGDQIPAEAAGELAELAALAAALPQAFAQLSRILQGALDSQVLSMDSLADDADPAVAVGFARLQLDAARALAIDLHMLLADAHNATAHISSGGQHASV